MGGLVGSPCFRAGRSIGSVLFALFAASLTGCDAEPTLQALGIIDVALAVPVHAVVLLDVSNGSPCSAGVFEDALERLLPEFDARPGSTVELWELGVGLADTRRLGTRSVAPSKHTGSTHTIGSRSIADREYLLKCAEMAFARPRKSRSPIAEGIGRIMLDHRGDGTRHILLVLSDGREVSALGDFECGRLPTPDAFTRTLRARHVLADGSLANTTIMFLSMTLAAASDRGCDMSLDRTQAIETLWSRALSAAGAQSVRFVYGELPEHIAGGSEDSR